MLQARGRKVCDMRINWYDKEKNKEAECWVKWVDINWRRHWLLEGVSDVGSSWTGWANRSVLITAIQYKQQTDWTRLTSARCALIHSHSFINQECGWAVRDRLFDQMVSTLHYQLKMCLSVDVLSSRDELMLVLSSEVSADFKDNNDRY